jgi:TMEM175 potassium channel family protein
VRTNRVEAFSDGVLAIAITLLILEISVPEVRGDDLLDALARQWPSYAAYVVSFLTIGIMWVNHHALFDHVRAVDRGLLFVNVFLLMAIAFVPFPTALLAAYLRSPDGGRVAGVIYCLTLLVVGFGFIGLWSYLRRHPEARRPELTDDDIARALRRTWRGPASYLAATLLSLVSPYAALAVCGAVAIYFVVPYGTEDHAMS